MALPEAALRCIDIAALGRAGAASLAGLQVSPEQEVLGRSFTDSLADWEGAPRALCLGLAFLFEGRPVGLTLFKRPPLSPDWAGASSATIHGLKIATPWQGRGWGHLAFRLAVARLREVWPEVTALRLAVDAENAAARAIYAAYGMTDSGPLEGPHGPEHRFAMSLR